VIARAMGLDAETVRQIELGGQLHDIGKIGVREEVLNKPGPLTPEEYQHIMTHPLLGWRILEPLMSDAPIALNIVRWHHERVDGRGVPDQLCGDRIPLEARIVAVADAIDAMMSGRPYRGEEMQLEDAIAELRCNCDTQFDRGVVQAALRAMEGGDLVLEPRAGQMWPPVSVSNA
jgi:HD-GYP domain-containing protein (c-di-GMP phosphodiesterase class II)